MPLDIILDQIGAKAVARMVDRVHRTVAHLDRTGSTSRCDGRYPNAVLCWKAGRGGTGALLMHRETPRTILQIICERPLGRDLQLEIAWPSADVPEDEPGLRDLVRRVTAMATLVALASHDRKEGSSETLEATVAEHRDAALRINEETGTYRGGAMTISSRTPWSTATVRLKTRHQEVETRGEIVEVRMPAGRADPSLDILSIMPHDIHAEIGMTIAP